MKQMFVFLDIDGTLFSPKLGRIPDSALEAVKKARANGSKIFLCTGRSLSGCNKYLGMDVDGFVFGAGAMVYAEHKRIFDHPLRKEDEEQIKEIIRTEGMGYAAEGQAGGYCDPMAYEILLKYFGGLNTEREEQMRKLGDNCFYPEYYEHPDEKIYKICAYVKHGGSFEQLRKRLPDIFDLTVTVRDPNFDDCAEITNASITKASGIERVLEFYGADRSESVGIGDSENDIPMINYCGTGIAMGNAMPAVRKIADWVTDPILEDGIQNAFRHLEIID